MKKILVVLLVALGLQTQAQVNCNSTGLGYITTQNTNYPFQAHATVMPWVFTQSDSVYYNWTICVRDTCYSSSNMAHTLLYFQMSLTDTVSLCYNAGMYYNNEIINTCSNCDNLIFNGGSWGLLNTTTTTTTTSIKELSPEKINDNRMYDLLGREFRNYHIIPAGQMYIMNGKKYIKGGLLRNW